MHKLWQFFNRTVIIALAIGCFLIIIGQSSLLSQIFPSITEKSSINTIIKSIGAALLGSGVFTAIIKSKEYTDVFSKIIEDIIFSKKFISKRSDAEKKEMWSTLSRLLYQEKFPSISNEIEEIITTHYFPIQHEHYINKSEVIINVSDINDDFWNQHETIRVTICPTNSKAKVVYKFITEIDLLSTELGVEDLTNYIIEEIKVNGTLWDPKTFPLNTKTTKTLCNTLILHLENSDEYKVVVKRCKVLSKKSNRDKRFFARALTKDVEITVIRSVGIKIDFHKMGTINDFEKADEEVASDLAISKWTYKGLILPHQGYIIIFK